MFKILLFGHVLFAIFAVGPLVHAATTASRGIRHADGTATASSARMARIYSYASVLVIIVGFALMSAKSPDTHTTTAKFSETWIWLSTLLWLAAIALVLGVLTPALDKATAQIGSGAVARGLTGRVAAAGGCVGVIFAVIVGLMIYQPGS